MAAGAIAEAVSGAIGGIFDAGKTIYDIWSNERDFDYQKRLQQDIFNREDTAVQRRMADLKAAGLNPNLAAGSAAGAGSVVGRSNTPSISGNPVGTALDMASAVQQLRKQKEENEILKNEKDKSKAEAEAAQWDTMASNYEIFSMLGMKPKIKYNYSTGEYDLTTSNNVEVDNAFNKLLKYQLMNGENSAAMLQKDNEWYTADKIADYVGNAARAYSSIGSGSFNLFGSRRRR